MGQVEVFQKNVAVSLSYFKCCVTEIGIEIEIAIEIAIEIEQRYGSGRRVMSLTIEVLPPPRQPKI